MKEMKKTSSIYMCSNMLKYIKEKKEAVVNEGKKPVEKIPIYTLGNIIQGKCHYITRIKCLDQTFSPFYCRRFFIRFLFWLLCSVSCS